MKIKTRIQVSIILCIVLTVTTGLFVFMSIHKISDESREARVAAIIVKDMAELNIVTHEYLLHPGERPLVQWKSKYGSLVKRLTREENKFDSPDTKIGLNKIHQDLVRLGTVFSNLSTGFVKEHGRQKDPISSELQDRLIGELLVKSQASVSPVFQLQRLIQDEMEATQKRFSSLVFIFLVVFMFLVVGILFWINKSIAGPIIMLEEGTQIIGAGNLSHKVGTEAKDEIGALSRSFDKMTKDLKKTTTSIDELRKEMNEREKAQEALRESEENLSITLNSIGDAVIATDTEGRIIRMNPIAEKLTGWSLSEAEGRPVTEVFNIMNERTRQRVESPVEKVMREGVIVGLANHTVLISKNGSESPIADSGAPIRNDQGDIVGVVLVFRDVSEKRKAELALRESEEKYRNLFNNAQVGLYRTRISDGKFVEANDALARMFGYEDRADILDSEYLAAENYVDPGTRENLLAILREHGEFRNFEARLYRKDRSATWFRYSGQIYPEKGYIEGVAADITEEKRLEKRLLQSQKMEAVGTLAGGVAHDLNNILSGLVGYPELILLDLPEDSPLRKPILTIQDSGHKAAVIVQDMLTLARRGVAITEVVNLNDIVYDHLKSPEHEKLKSFHTNAEFEINLAPDLLNIMGSPVHLSKTIMNLLSNAAEAMPDTGTITISTSNQYLDRPVRGYEDVQEGDYVVLSVVDSGVGMSEEDLARIFEPFYTKKVMGRSGTGLGMAVIWGTVKDHNGYIDIESTFGKGTRFDLFFPVTRREPAEKRVTVSIDEFMGSERILVVDDIKEQREIAFKILTKLGYSVTAVSSGEEAVEYMKENSADLLILDMIMDPGIDGLDTYKKIIQIHPGQKAIIASGYSKTERVKEAQRLGAGQYIKKPYTLEKIGIAVRDALKK